MSLAEQLQAAQLKPVGGGNSNRQSKDMSNMSLAEQLQAAQLKPTPTTPKGSASASEEPKQEQPKSFADQLKQKNKLTLEVIDEDENDQRGTVKPGEFEATLGKQETFGSQSKPVAKTTAAEKVQAA